MPPGQPVHKCAHCGHYRPCKPDEADRWTCVDCAGLDAVAGDQTAVATDGGVDS